ncbi:MAG: Lpg1974 family pore-forming outer membrane protein [Pirellulales bacterium]
MNSTLRLTLAAYVLVSLLCGRGLADEWDTIVQTEEETVYTATTPVFTGGFDIVFAKPVWERNPVATVTESDGATFESIQTQEFDYDFQVAPRVWLTYQANNEIGARVSYWQFDQDPTAYTVNPPANGFGRVAHPAFGGVDIGSTIPAETFSASSYLALHSVDLDITKSVRFGEWDLVTFAGVRFAQLDQGYSATLSNAAKVIAGRIDYSHQFKGFGPTIGLETRRPHSAGVSLFASARGTLLIGGADARLDAGEDLDLANPFLTTSVDTRTEVIPVGDLRLGLDWTPMSTVGAFQPFARLAFEGQIWGGAGNSTSEDGNLGFVGLSVGGGVAY